MNEDKTEQVPRRLSWPLGIAVALAVWGTGIDVTSAQEYCFAVPNLDMMVTVNPDASVKIVYDITFHNEPFAHPIDVVDIGTPDQQYSLGNIVASIDGTNLHDIRKSSYIDCGFEVQLGGQTIPPGGKGTLHVEFTMPDRVYQDTTRDDYASLQLTPTWFGEPYVVGDTHIRIVVQLPKSVHPDEVLHQGVPFSRKAATDDGTVVGWNFPAARLTGPNKVAVSFPRRDLDRVVTKTRWDMLIDWFTNATKARLFLGVVGLGLLAWSFFRFSGGTGVSVFVVLMVALVILYANSPQWHLLSLPILIGLVALNEWALDRRKAHYMPPIAEVEGGGIKRGLTAPEAAAILEAPIAKVLTLVIFGMLKKGIVRQVQGDPLVVQLDEEFHAATSDTSGTSEQRRQVYRKAGQERGVVVHVYEYPFLFLIEQNPGKPLQEIDFSIPMKELLSRAANRMKGFDLSDTQEYYRSIVRRASEQASAIGDISQRQKAIDKNLEWILVDDDYSTVFSHGHPYHPVWARSSVGSGTTTPSVTTSPPSTGTTSFSDVAASFAGWTENTMGNLANTIAPGSLGVAKSSGGFLDLSGCDHVTGAVLEALSESGGGGGGGGGCACAGCACACACAGGGR